MTFTEKHTPARGNHELHTPQKHYPMKKTIFSMLAAGTMLLASCSQDPVTRLTESGLDPSNFKTDSTALFVLTNKNGMEVCITNYGGRIASITVPDRNGIMRDVVLGFDNVASYLPENNKTDFGAVIGRYANRIDHGRFALGDSVYQLTTNNGVHSLHGGTTGWQYRTFKARQVDEKTLELTLTSPDGDNGYPGTVNAKAVYTLTDDNAIDIQTSATTDRPTVVNMTNHAYFNLNADAAIPVTNNILYVNADRYTPVDSTFMTSGEIASVAGTPFDFNKPTEIGLRINDDNEQLHNGNGYDHNWVLNGGCDINRLAASVVSPVTGIKLEVYTDKPGLQVYTGNFLDGTVKGKKGTVYRQRTAICLEPQVFPDSPNKKGLGGWYDPTVTPEKPYSHHFIYKFSVEK